MKSQLRLGPLNLLKPAERFRISHPLRPAEYGELSARLPGFPLLAVNALGEIVAGLDYYYFLAESGASEIWFLQDDYNDLQGLFLGFNLKRLLTGVNLYEKLIFLSLAAPAAPTAEIYRETGLDIPVTPQLTAALPILTGESFRTALIPEAITLKTALALCGMKEPDRCALLELFIRLSFTSSHQLKVIEMAEELIFRDKIPLAEILEKAGVPALLENNNGSSPQKAVLEALFLLRNPLLAEMENRWEEDIRELKLPAGVRVNHYPNFEKRKMEMIVPVADMEALRRLADKLGK